MKKVYIIHGWEGSPKNNWFPWLKQELEGRGFEVVIPRMPNPETPEKLAWVKALSDLEPSPDENVIMVGHSMGCQAIQRYLESLPDGKKIGGAVLVAGWINDPHWEGRTEEELVVINDWFAVPKDYAKIKSHCKKFISIFSTNDPFISKSNWDEAKRILASEIVILEDKSHFDDEAGITKLPEALDAVLEIANMNQ